MFDKLSRDCFHCRSLNKLQCVFDATVPAVGGSDVVVVVIIVIGVVVVVADIVFAMVAVVIVIDDSMLRWSRRRFCWPTVADGVLAALDTPRHRIVSLLFDMVMEFTRRVVRTMLTRSNSRRN